MTADDASKHRMSFPVLYDPYAQDAIDLASVTISPRFAVEQGKYLVNIRIRL